MLISNSFEPPFQVEVPTTEVIRLTDLVNGLNNLSSRIINNVNSKVTVWDFQTLTSALKGVVMVHEHSPKNQLISHRLLCGENVIMQYGEFSEFNE